MTHSRETSHRLFTHIRSGVSSGKFMRAFNLYQNLFMHPSCDSQKIIHYALTSDDLHQYTPRQILMSWIMDLGQNIDPAAAAKTLIETYAEHPGFIPGDPQKELLTLLYEVSISDPKKQKRGHASARKRYRVKKRV